MTEAATPTQDNMPVFNIEKIYIKDLSVEVPNAPQVFLEREAPQMEMQMNTQSAQVEDDIYQCVLSIIITAKTQAQTAFLVEIHQAGVFRIKNLPKEAMEPALGVGCPNILFPYAREAITDVVQKAGFPPLMLQPVNFETLYLQQRQAGSQQPN